MKEGGRDMPVVLRVNKGLWSGEKGEAKGNSVLVKWKSSQA